MKLYLVTFEREKCFYVGDAIITASNEDEAYRMLSEHVNKTPEKGFLSKETCRFTEINANTKGVKSFSSGYF